MDRILIWFLSFLIFIPRVVWANLSYIAADISPDTDNPPVEFLNSVPKKKKKYYRADLSIPQISRRILANNIQKSSKSSVEMKNLMIYISSSDSLHNPLNNLIYNAQQLIKVQIENSLSLGWKKEDIILVTNFDFRYMGITAVVLKDIEFTEWFPQASKINTIVRLFEKGLIRKNELYWFHDLDAFQLVPIKISELRLGKAHMALTDYNPASLMTSFRWNTSSIFFTENSKDIFYLTKEIMYVRKHNEEKVLQELTDSNENIRKRIKNISRAYSFAPFSNKECYKTTSSKPKVAHFQPLDRNLRLFEDPQNPNIGLIPKSLLKVFRYHEIT